MNRIITTVKIIALLFITTTLCNANIINVPSNYPTIQSAINASVNNDTIAVAPGTYFENINFRGKNIVLTSLFYLTGDTNYIYNTIINGSQPLNPDSASCIIFNSGEDSTAVLQGFTITGGHGTKWDDEHGAGVYREGGGVIIQYSSPVIQHNLIVNNEAIDIAGVSGAGGGGIRTGDGNPKILNNTICYNQGKYGEGIVLNFTGGTVKNNLICYNSGGSTFGAASVWSNGSATQSRIIENNTITNNNALNGTAGFYASQTSGYQLLINNIIYDNYSTTTPSQIQKYGASPTTVAYCNVGNGGYPGNGNISLSSSFSDTNYFYLNASSACVDAGDSTAIYNDLTVTGTTALFPSMGGLRNDIGAYGGQGASWLPSANPIILSINNIDLNENYFSISPNPVLSAATISFILKQNENVQLSISDINGKNMLTLENKNLNIGTHTYTLDRKTLKAGIYFCNLKTDKNSWSKKLIVE
ncbi:MAG: T9SS type A sorting domain-containing protein [Bacteroidia bacterium]